MSTTSELNVTVRPWDPRLQRERGARLMGLVREAARRFFHDDGRCALNEVLDFDMDHLNTPDKPFYLRERVNCVLALLAGSADDVAFGNRVLDHIELSSCDFTTMNLVEMLLRHPERVSPANTARLRAHIAEEITAIRTTYNFYIGANDNFPSMGTFLFIVGGELAGDDAAVQAGIDNLYALRDMLTRRGFFSEYNSPTYAGVTLHGLDETMNNARNPEARELARQASERMCLDIAAHWHPSLSFQAGPFSRAYHNNSIAWSALTNILLWVTFGDSVFLNPMVDLFQHANTSFEKRANNLEFCQAGCGGYAGTVHHIPDYIGELFLTKTFPFRVSGSTEMGTFHYGDYRRTPEGTCIHVSGACADYGADAAYTTTYLEEEFALGTSTRPFCGGGQTDLFHEIHRLRPGASSWADIRAVFTRYLVNDAQPEDKENMGLLVQQGNGTTIQDDRRALVLFHPSGYKREGITTLKLSLVLQEMTSPVEEIWIGDRKLTAGDGESVATDWVILRDGPVMLAFYPLNGTDLGRQVAIRSEGQHGYRVISFYNYQGPARDFPMHDLQTVQNGFICEVTTLNEHADVPAFLADLRQAEMVDFTVLEGRSVRYLREGRELFLWMDPAQQTVKAAAVNGRQIGDPPLYVDGVDLSRIPWLNGGVQHHDLAWWQRIAARRDVLGLEGVSGRRVE
jgi:hypothetical protein